AAQHTIADGPYQIKSYVPAKSIQFVRNPAWQASSDPLRKAYVDAINIKETGDPVTNQTELATNSAAAGMERDTFPPVASIPQLTGQMKAGSTQYNLAPSFPPTPYIVFNATPPNNGGALAKGAARQAITYAITRAPLIQDDNAPLVSPPLTHILPNGINGA